MVWCVAAAFALGVVNAAAHGCLENDMMCIENDHGASAAALVQKRAPAYLQGSFSLLEKDTQDSATGEDVVVHCDPSCNNVDEFSMTLVSRTHGNMTYKMLRQRDLVSPNFHITILQDDDTVIRKQVPQHLLDCHYHGDRVGGFGWVTASTCGAMRATVVSDTAIAALQQRSNGAFVLGGPSLPDEEEAPALTEFEDYVESEKKECDGGPCCTGAGAFKAKGTACTVDDIGYCHEGGVCTGDDSDCQLNILPNGSPCPDLGSCFDGDCISRDRQCEAAGYHYGACGENECELLRCLQANGTCGEDFDLPVEPGTPCGKSMQCGFDSKCGPSSNLDKDTHGHVTTVMHPVTRQPSHRAYNNQQEVAKIAFVVSGFVERGGWNQQKVQELASWLDGVYSRQAQLKIQLVSVVMAGNSANYDPAGSRGLNDFTQFVSNAKKQGKVSKMAGITHFLHGGRCSGVLGVAWMTTACTGRGTGINYVTGSNGACPGSNGILDKIVVAHEVGHNLGMPHLWENGGGRQGSTQFIMDYSQSWKPEFHRNSIASFKKSKGRMTCLRGAEPSGDFSPGVDTISAR